MSTRLLRICVTGSESTGKTTLVQRLAEDLDTEWVPEASRVYAERVARELTSNDVEPIAREHIALADAAAERVRAQEGKVLVLDTDLLSTIVYGDHYYGSTPEWIGSEEQARRADLYLLCDVDVPWVPDGIRDRPTNREALVERDARTVIVRGDWRMRWLIALVVLAELQEQ